MLRRITATAQKPMTEYHAVLDEHSPGDGSIGTVLAVYPSSARARRFANNLKEAARLTKAGSSIKWAFHPGVNTEALQRIISASPQVRPRIVQIIEDLPVGAHVHPRLHLATSGHPPGSLRCL